MPCMTSQQISAASLAVTLLWILTVNASTVPTTVTTIAPTPTTATPTPSSPAATAPATPAPTSSSSATTTTTSSTTAAPLGSDVVDHGVCTTRFLGYDDKTGSGDDVLGIAVINELHRSDVDGCGNVSLYGLQTAASLVWAVRRLNGEGIPGAQPYIPGIKLNLKIFDDCSQNLIAARHVGDLLDIHKDFTCTPASPLLAGVVGTTTSVTTTTVARILANTQIPFFGMSATVSSLSNKTIYPTFYRTVPSDITQSRVMVDLAKALKWTYVAGIYTSDNYGTDGFMEFKRLAELEGICVFKSKAFWHTDPDVDQSMEDFIRELLIDLISMTRYKTLGVVYFGHDMEAKMLFDMIEENRSKWNDQDRVLDLHWIFSDGVGTSKTVAGKAQDLSHRLFSISPAVTPLDDVTEFFIHNLDYPQELGPYWQSLATAFLQEQYQCTATVTPVTACNLRSRIQFTQDYLSNVMDSFYSLVVLIQQTHSKICGGSLSPGLCQKMAAEVRDGLLSTLKPRDLNYTRMFPAASGDDQRLPEMFRKGRQLVKDDHGDFMSDSSPLYFVNHASNGNWNKIGEYTNSSLQLQSATFLSSQNMPNSECGNNCVECRQHRTVKFHYIPGDVVLMGLYSISNAVSGLSFECGDYRGQDVSVAALRAFLYTLEQWNTQDGVSTRFGALVLDDCYSKLVVSGLLTDLYNGKTTLVDPRTDQTVDMRKVVAAVGSQSSSVTLSALNLLTPLELPIVSYSATSPDLDDRNSFPYFLRPVPSDSQQAQALVDLVRNKLNVTYVGLVYQDNNYGLRGMQKFIQLASAVGLCVREAVAVSDSSPLDVLLQIFKNLSNNAVKVVVTFITESTAARVLDAIDNRGYNLVFVASEAWGVTSLTLQGNRGMTGRGSLVLTVNNSKRAWGVDLTKSLSSLTSQSVLTSDDPWLRDFWEHQLRCNLPGSFTNAYTRMCGDSEKLNSTQVLELSNDQKVVQTINAVASVVQALNNTCAIAGNPADCMLKLSAQSKTDRIRNIGLPEQTLKPYSYGNVVYFQPYLDNGNGNVGFTINNLQKSSDVRSGYKYVQVGSYNPDSNLQITQPLVFYSLTGQEVNTISSSCDYVSVCSAVCGKGPVVTDSPPVSTAAPVDDGDRGGLVAALVLMVLLCVACVVLLVGIVWCARRRGRIPLLGFVKKNETDWVARWSGGRGVSNQGFSSPDPHSPVPLPPIPGDRESRYTSSYDVPDDLSASGGRVSISRSSLSANPESASGGRGFRYDPTAGSDSGDLGRRRKGSRNETTVLRVYPQQQQKNPPRHPPSPRQIVEEFQERPRSKSLSNEVRPSRVRKSSSPGSVSTTTVSMANAGRGRPRANSQDAGFRNRLGALSAGDQEILMKYISTTRARQFCHTPDSAPRQQSRPIMTSAQSGRVPTPTQTLSATMPTPQITLPPQNNLSSVDSPPPLPPLPLQTNPSLQNNLSPLQGDGLLSPDLVFQNPLHTNPSFCSSKSSLWPSYEMEWPVADDSSLMYLHAVPTDQEMYLQMLPAESVQQSNSAHPSQSSDTSGHDAQLSPQITVSSLPLACTTTDSSQFSPQSVTASSVLANLPPQQRFRTISESERLNVSTGSPSPSVHRQSLPNGLLLTQVSRSSKGSSSSNPAQSPASSNPRERTASESSGAVFVSPDQEYPVTSTPHGRGHGQLNPAGTHPHGTIPNPNQGSQPRPTPPQTLALFNSSGGRASPRANRPESSPALGHHEQPAQHRIPQHASSPQLNRVQRPDPDRSPRPDANTRGISPDRRQQYNPRHGSSASPSPALQHPNQMNAQAGATHFYPEAFLSPDQMAYQNVGQVNMAPQGGHAVQTTPVSSAAHTPSSMFPGMFMRDSQGTLYLVPHLVPLHPGLYPSHTNPALQAALMQAHGLQNPHGLQTPHGLQNPHGPQSPANFFQQGHHMQNPTTLLQQAHGVPSPLSVHYPSPVLHQARSMPSPLLHQSLSPPHHQQSPHPQSAFAGYNAWTTPTVDNSHETGYQSGASPALQSDSSGDWSKDPKAAQHPKKSHHPRQKSAQKLAAYQVSAAPLPTGERRPKADSAPGFRHLPMTGADGLSVSSAGAPVTQHPGLSTTTDASFMPQSDANFNYSQSDHHHVQSPTESSWGTDYGGEDSQSPGHVKDGSRSPQPTSSGGSRSRANSDGSRRSGNSHRASPKHGTEADGSRASGNPSDASPAARLATLGSSLHREDSIPYIQGFELAQPQPCGPNSRSNQLSGSGGSGSSGPTTSDSGNGDDLNNDASNEASEDNMTMVCKC